MYNFKIKKIITNNNKEIYPKQINVIIGPNNSGKSQFLKDIKNSLLRYNNPYSDKTIVIKSLEYDLPSDFDEFVERYRIKDLLFKTSDNQYYIRNYSGISSNMFHIHNNFSNYLDSGNINIYGDWEETLKNQINNFNNNICIDEKIKKEYNLPDDAVIRNENYAEYLINGQLVKQNISGSGGPLVQRAGESIIPFIDTYGALFTNYLGTEEKLLMCKKQQKYGLQDSSTNFLSEVQFNSKLLDTLSNYTKKLFKRDVYLDRYSWGSEIVFRVGDNFDFIRNSRKDDSDVEIKLKDYNILDDEGDGIKSFITNYLALNMNDKNILLLDEPETFLHPPLARQLGEIIGLSASDEKQIFISTHSADLLRGLVNSGCEINIIRITRKDDYNEINQIDRKTLNEVILSPSLSSGNVLNGLFSEKVYLCEAESDEEFYQALHDKVELLDTAFFTHTKNKQTLKNLSKIYNDLKIPNYRIYDFDIFKDKDLNKAIKGVFDEKQINKYIELKNQMQQSIGIDEKYHNGGINAIDEKHLIDEVNIMLNDLKKNGIIILKYGCLETNLINEGIQYSKNNKDGWLENAIQYIYETDVSILENTYIYKWIFKNDK